MAITIYENGDAKGHFFETVEAAAQWLEEQEKKEQKEDDKSN